MHRPLDAQRVVLRVKVILFTVFVVMLTLFILSNKSFTKCEDLYDGKPKYWQYIEPITLHAYTIICTANSV